MLGAAKIALAPAGNEGLAKSNSFIADAQAKLDAVSDIERSLSERKPSAESRTP